MESSPNQSGDEGPPFRFSLKAMFIAFTVLTIAIGGPFVLIRGALRTVDDAYRAWGTADMLVAYMDANHGQWPKRWGDVRTFMVNHPAKYHTVADFEEVREHMEIDFSFDPAAVDTTIEFNEDAPAFRAVWLRNGSSARWEGAGPNEIIFAYLKAARDRDATRVVTPEAPPVTAQ
jgi:hypothetical protein